MLYYDSFCQYLTKGVSADIVDAIDITKGAIKPKLIRRMIKRVEDSLAIVQSTKIYVFSADATRCVEETMDRLTKTPLFEPPRVPVWLEFEGSELTIISGDGQQNSVHAFMLYPEPGKEGQYHCDIIYGAMGYMEIIFLSSTQWVYQIQECMSTQCPFSSRKEVMSDFASEHNVICSCEQFGLAYSKFITTLLLMLRAEGVEHTIVQAQATQKKKPGKVAKSTAKTPRAATWVRISLTEKQHVLRDTTSSVLQSALVPNEMNTHMREIEGYHRLLIPGPGKPWRGDVPRVIWVNGHRRRVHGMLSVRYKVTP